MSQKLQTYHFNNYTLSIHNDRISFEQLVNSVARL